ncbi:putative PGG domain-containing protein [Helianthus annuus]|uniref:PGG domain-containing protein n=2 Tax=Helianthus annuus TaxID=4232 RepID=A0A9K3NHK2_HELAN|nr:putative PGG domain-containing protein [Helianthus annuus]KAJ0572042.1 putative PGG domain-containing protein [Helianthus annuus]KAJ0910132.1 putative PGG domain-containing protein [Helianthus annuus]
MNINLFLHKIMKDKDGNNLLHLAAQLAPIHKLNVVSGAALQMQRELQWFKLRKEGEELMKKTADSYTITATLIITIVFAAAITIPGGNNGDTGKAIYLTRPSFIVFAISDAISLFTSTTSLLSLLSILTARYCDEDFLYKLPKRLIDGLVMLFLSVTSLMVAFSTALYTVSGQENNWILIPIAALTCLPVASFVTLQFPLLVELISSTPWYLWQTK